MSTATSERTDEALAGDDTSRYQAPRYRRILGIDRNNALFWALLAGLALFVLAPVVPTLFQALRDRPLYQEGGVFTLENFVSLFTEADFGRVALNTILFAGLTTVLTIAIAVPMAIAVVRTNLPGRRVFAVLLQWPFFISSLILGFGWITIYGPAGFISVEVRSILGFIPWNLYSIYGMAITEAVAMAPIAYLFCANVLRQADSSLEDAARSVGAGPFRILRSVIIPQLRPPVVYSVILVFSMSVETLSVPLIYGTPADITVFSTFLYRNGLQSVNPDYGVLGAASVVILVITVLLVAMQAKLLSNAQRFVSVRGKATRPRTLDLGWIKWIAVVVIAFYAVFGAAIPVLGLIFRSFTRIFTPLQNPFDSLTMDNYNVIFDFPAYSSSITNSLIVAGAGALIISAIAMLSAVVARRSTFRRRRLVEYLSLAPQAMPGLIVGIGLFWAFTMLPFGLNGLIQGTLAALVIGFGYRALPSAFGSISPSIMQISPELDNASRVAGADWLRTFTRVLASLLTPAFGAAVILTFVTMFKEYSPAVFLGSGNTKVIGTTMLELWAQGITGPVAALATIQIVLTTIFVLIAGLLMKGRRNA